MGNESKPIVRRMPQKQRNCNFRLNKTRITVKHAFGQLKGRWRCRPPHSAHVVSCPGPSCLHRPQPHSPPQSGASHPPHVDIFCMLQLSTSLSPDILSMFAGSPDLRERAGFLRKWPYFEQHLPTVIACGRLHIS